MRFAKPEQRLRGNAQHGFTAEFIGLIWFQN